MNVVSTGFSMIEVIRKVRAIVNFPGLDMRIGVHTVWTMSDVRERLSGECWGRSW